MRNSLTVTVDRVRLVEQVITRALESGVNHVNNIDFQTTKLRKYRDEARRMALRAAREKGENMAGVYGQTIGKPLQINENGYGTGDGAGMRGPQIAMNAATVMPSTPGGSREAKPSPWERSPSVPTSASYLN